MCIVLHFLLLEAWKSRFFEVGIILLAALLLPFLKTVKWKSVVVPLPFLYRGGLEYIRMFRIYGCFYLLFIVIALIEAVHDNIRIGKVAMIIWRIIQATAYTSIPQRQELTFFSIIQFFKSTFFGQIHGM